MPRSAKARASGLMPLLALALSSCDPGAGVNNPDPNQMMPPAFEANQAFTYTAKVKMLLTSLPPTEAELRQVMADPKSLATLADKWMTLPEFREKSLGFFQNAFQQGQISLEDLNDMMPERFLASVPNMALMLQNIKDSFPRTVWQLSEEGRPLTEAITTERYQLTTAMMVLLSYVDVSHVDDQEKRVNRIIQKTPTWSWSLVTNQQIPIEQSLDEKHANYMKFSTPIMVPAECRQDVMASRLPHALFTLLFGAVRLPNPCPNFVRGGGPITEADFADWRWVTIRKPKAGEATSTFWDVVDLRKGKELVLNVPRIGFFGTPAFQANWMTNSSNEARVTINQALIVGLGKSFDDTNSTTPVSEAALSKDHAGPGTVCYGCHKTLDPMRQFFRQSYTLYYHEQTDAKQLSIPAAFAFDGVSKTGTGIKDLATFFAQHPRFAKAWTQKLCFYLNSSVCVDDDPEFQRVFDVFAKGGHKWKTLVRELVTSPLTTGTKDTKSFQEHGVVTTISRRDHLCVALSKRLGIVDICGVSGAPALTPTQRQALVLANDMPADGYARGAETPLFPNDPSMFFRGATENLCRVIAEQVVDKPNSRYSTMKPDLAIKDFVETIMGMSAADPRAAEAGAILTDHYNKAGKNVNALKSTFILACEAPSSVAIGL